MAVSSFGVFILGILFVQATPSYATTTCYQTNFGFTFTVYCGDHEYCCGTQENRECCEHDDDITGIIVGAVVGVIFLVAVVIGVICIIKHCNRTQRGGVITPYPITSGHVITHQYPATNRPSPGMQLQPLSHNYNVPQTGYNTAVIQPTVNVRQDIITRMTFGQGDIPPAFNYIPPSHVHMY